MDAYDQIQAESLSPDEAKDKQLGRDPSASESNLNTELQDAYKAISASPWGQSLGGLWGSVKKQSETYIATAQKELAAASTEASKGITDLVNQTKIISLASDASASSSHPVQFDPNDPSTYANKQEPATTSTSTTSTAPVNELTTDSLVSEAKQIFSRFQSVTSSRLAALSKAENAADEALERYGRNLRAFLKDAVVVAPPSRDAQGKIIKRGSGGGPKRFESKDAEGRRVVHATRFDAQLHVIHTRDESFARDPEEAEGEFAAWKSQDFDIKGKTEDIARDLEKYDGLRRAMERLVPETVDYEAFWTRYYFLRHVVETEEKRRRELLKGAKDDEDEEVGWGDEEEEEEEKTEKKLVSETVSAHVDTESATPTKSGDNGTATSQSPHLKPSEPRRSNEHSVADSDASYDIMSAGTSRGPGTPAPALEAVSEEKAKPLKENSGVVEESEEDDWE